MKQSYTAGQVKLFTLSNAHTRERPLAHLVSHLPPVKIEAPHTPGTSVQQLARQESGGMHHSTIKGNRRSSSKTVALRVISKKGNARGVVDW